MFKSALAGILSFALVTGATPASAQQLNNNDLLKLLGIGAAAVVVGKAIKDRRDDRRDERARAAAQAEAERQRYYSNNQRIYRDNGNGYSREFRRANRHCKRQRWTDDGWQTFWNKKCLKRAAKAERKNGNGWKHGHQAQFPRECLRQRWTNNGWQKYYSNRCLSRHGLRADVRR